MQQFIDKITGNTVQSDLAMKLLESHYISRSSNKIWSKLENFGGLSTSKVRYLATQIVRSDKPKLVAPITTISAISTMIEMLKLPQD